MSTLTRFQRRLTFAVAAVIVTFTVPAAAIEPPAGGSFADDLAFDHPDMYVLNYQSGTDELSPMIGAALDTELLTLGAANGFYDLRAGRWGSLILSRPLVPGSGAGNLLAWADLGVAAPESEAQLEAIAGQAFAGFLQQFSAQLGVDLSELGDLRATSHDGGRLIQINAGRQIAGVPVHGAYVHGVVNSGNLILYGTRNWGDVAISTTPAISAAEALTAVDLYVTPVPQTATMREPALLIYPMKNGDAPSEALLGDGFAHRLAWQVQLTFDGDHGSWRALVDAQTGEVFSFADQNHYATRKVTGGVFPVSNDGLAPNGVPDGIEQPGWPMPFADVTFGGSPGNIPDTFTNSSGVISCVDGTISTKLSGRYVNMADNCGAASESTASGDLDLGASGGTDCAVPAGGSPGNTHSSRSGFYEVARIQEQARSWLPDNPWLHSQLTANMNIDDSCNAFWNGSTINFYRSGGGCGNTGEIAAVFDHEWGHGMDANDQVPGISTPGEAPADHYAIFRLNTSCIGRGFFQSGTCGGQGDPCLECTGVREADWTKRASGMPHNVTWVKQATVTPVDGPLAPRGGCVGNVAIPVLQSGPCLQSTHCEGSVVSEAVWDLIHRDLAGAPYNMDVNTRLNLVTRLGYLGGTNVNFWYQCVDTPEGGTAGCNSDGGYMNYLAVDDDNGDLSDGTPHMDAIYNAFARHQLACPTPAPAANGCASKPATPTVTVEALDNAAKVTWNAVPGAQEYWLFKADGQNACEFGKERIVLSGTEYVDTTLQNGREYYYTVEAVGTGDSCRSAASACQSVTPSPGANLQISEGSTSVAGLSGDGDPFIDNCESVRVSFDVENSGNLPLTNVRIVAVDSPSHPGVQVVSSLPQTLAASLADCDLATGSFDLYATGIDADDTITLQVTLLADEMGGVARTETIQVANGESDFIFTPSRTFAFNGDGDLEGWEVASGTYSQLPGGPPLADPGGSFLTSSTFQDNACDTIESPLLRLSGTSTLSLWNQFSIEPPLPVFGDVFYDRANVGVLDAASGTRTTVDPDGGRLYNASGPNGVCVTAGENGWADAAGTWDQSTWSAAALDTATHAGNSVRIQVAYGTDPTLSGAGFQFDFVTLTDVEIQGADSQSDACDPGDPGDPPSCGDLDDADPAVEYQTGWHRRTDGGSNGGYHRRMGSHNTGNGNGSTPIARLAFSGDEVTYHYVMSDRGGAADIYIDGALVETLSYGANQPGKENPTFGHSRTYSGLGSGDHELVIEHKYGAVYVDGFTVPCASGAADPSAADFGSETQTSSGSSAEGPVLVRTVEVTNLDQHVSAVVEGSLLPVTVRILDPAGGLLAEGASLLGGATSGTEAPTLSAGTYTVQVLHALGAFDTVEISIARTVANP